MSRLATLTALRVIGVLTHSLCTRTAGRVGGALAN